MYRQFNRIWLILSVLLFTGCGLFDGSQSIPFTIISESQMFRSFGEEPLTKGSELFIIGSTLEAEAFYQRIAGYPSQPVKHYTETKGLRDQLSQLDYTRPHDNTVRIYANFIRPRKGGIFGPQPVGMMATDPYQAVSILKNNLEGQQIRFELIDNNVVVATTMRMTP